MSATTGQASVTGVQELINRIRGDGVEAARTEGERILAEARKQAADVKARADAQAKALLEKTRAQIATEQSAAAEAIRNAARDSMLELRNRVRQAFEVHVRRLVSMQAQDPGFVRSLVLVLAGEAAAKHITDKDAEIFVSSALAGSSDSTVPKGAVQDKITHAVLGAAGQMLREGVQLLPDDNVKGGARVRLVGKDMEIDMTDEALSRLLLKNLLPRYRTIIQEEAGGN